MLATFDPRQWIPTQRPGLVKSLALTTAILLTTGLFIGVGPIRHFDVASAKSGLPLVTWAGPNPLAGIFRRSPARELSYAEFLAAGQRGEISYVTILSPIRSGPEGKKIVGSFKAGGGFQTTTHVSPWGIGDDMAILRQKGVSIFMPARMDPSHPNIGPADFYLAEAKAAKVLPTVVLLLFVDETGDVAEAYIDTSSGFQGLDDASVAVALNEWRFLPARRDGNLERTKIRIGVHFLQYPDRMPKPE